MKHITENEFIITTTFEPTSKDSKRGYECEQSEVVNRVEFFHYEYGKSRATKISLSRKEILQLADKIKEIESFKKVMMYEPMPF